MINLLIMKPTLLSGGAKGADLVFERFSKEKNYNSQIYNEKIMHSVSKADKDKYDKCLIHINKTYLHIYYK